MVTAIQRVPLKKLHQLNAILKRCINSLHTRERKSKRRDALESYIIELFCNVLDYHAIDEFIDRAIDDVEFFEKLMLNGANNIYQYNKAGCSLVYNYDIAKNILTPSQFKRWQNTGWNINLLDMQGEYLQAAFNLLGRVHVVEKSVRANKGGSHNAE